MVAEEPSGRFRNSVRRAVRRKAAGAGLAQAIASNRVDSDALAIVILMSVPQVVIVGRPNVGKSSVLNWLAGVRIAIVDDQPGVTRDRVTHLMCHDDRFFELVDTGGMGIADMDNLTRHIEDQINLAIDSADVILFVVDTREGMLPLDQEVARRLRSVNVPIILLANKADDERIDPQADEFYRLGTGKPLRISTLQNRNRAGAAEHDRLEAAAGAGRRSGRGRRPSRK